MVTDIQSRAQLESATSAFPEANFLQSWEWGQFAESLGKPFVRRAILEDDQVKAFYTAVVEDARRGRFMTVAGGPIYSNIASYKEILLDIIDQAKAHDCVFVRIRPQTTDSDQARAALKDSGWSKAPMSLSVEHAGVLDMMLGPDEISANMSQSLRRKIRKSQKLEIDISVSTEQTDIEEFYAIHHEHSKRQAYVPFSQKFLVNQFRVFADTGRAKLYIARKDGQVVASNFVIFYGQEASYHYGVSTALGVKLSSAPLLHLRAMEDARNLECTRYNFWGIVDPEAADHRYYGVSQFKRSFGVSDLKHVPAHDFVIKKAKYRANWLLETARRKKRKL